jgi:hypothetical protein
MTRPPGHTEQTAMHPTISYYLAQARMAGLGRHAQRDAVARLARRSEQLPPATRVRVRGSQIEVDRVQP